MFWQAQNVGLAIEISFLSHRVDVILVFHVYRPPYWIFHFQKKSGNIPVSAIYSYSRCGKKEGSHWNFCSIYWEAEICVSKTCRVT